MAESKEKILYEATVALKKEEFYTLLSLTESKITFEQKKGLIKKTNKIIKTISLEDIKIIKDKVQIEQQDQKVIIKTKNENHEILFQNKKEAKKFIEEIKEAIYGEDYIDRAINKADKAVKKIKKAANVIGEVADIAGTVGASVALKNNPKKIKELGELAINMIKKK